MFRRIFNASLVWPLPSNGKDGARPSFKNVRIGTLHTKVTPVSLPFVSQYQNPRILDTMGTTKNPNVLQPPFQTDRVQWTGMLFPCHLHHWHLKRDVRHSDTLCRHDHNARIHKYSITQYHLVTNPRVVITIIYHVYYRIICALSRILFRSKERYR